MPVQHILVLGIPIPLHTFPKVICLLGQSLLSIRTIFKVFFDANKSLCQKSGFHQIPSIIQIAKGNHGPCGTIDPMRPCSVKAIGIFQEIQEGRQPFEPFRSGDISSFYSDQNGHKAKSRASGCYNAFTIARVVWMISFPCPTGIGIGKIPKVFKGGCLGQV